LRKLEPFHDSVNLVRMKQQLRQRGIVQAWQYTFKQAFLLAPDTLFSQRHRQGLALVHGVLDAFQCANVFRQGVVNQYLGFTFGLQAVQHTLHPAKLSSQYGLGQFEHVIPGHIQHGRLNLLIASSPSG
jgi:hypothetical protein